MTSVVAPLLGCQIPRIENVPPYVKTAGDDAIELAAIVGMPLDEWQQRIMRGALGLCADGKWSAREVGVVVSRQNGKSSTVEIAALTGMFLRKLKVIYTSHVMTSSRKMRERIQHLIEDCPDLDREVKQIRTSNEEQSIELKSRARIDFVARTGAAGRGWTKYGLIFLDEAFALTADQVAALLPTMFASRSWQIWYVSMAGKRDSTALRRVRTRGIKGDPGLAYFEWSVPEDVYRAAPEYVANMPVALAQANPALGIRIDLETLQLAQRSMDPDEFAREVLGVWDDPRGESLIDPMFWSLLADPFSKAEPRQRVYALDASEGLRRGAIVMAGRRKDDIAHVEVPTAPDGTLDYRPAVDWMVPRAVAITKAEKEATWIMDGSGPCRAMLPDLKAAGIDPILINGRELAQAHGEFLKAIISPDRDQLRHTGQECLKDAIDAVRKRNLGDGPWVFGRRVSEGDITPVLAAAHALHGLMVYGPAAYDVLASVR